ncbi:MAG: tetratricopeptide repeat protein [bacterium]
MKSWIKVFLVVLLVTVVPNAGFTADTPPLQRGLNALEDGRTQRAIKYMETVLDKDPLNETALAELGNIYLQREKPSKAFKYYSRLSQLPPDKITKYRAYEVYYTTAKLAHQLDRYARTIQLINRAQSILDPSMDGYKRLKEQMEGWKDKARADQLRLKGQKRKQQIRSIFNRTARLILNKKFGKARQFLNRQNRILDDVSSATDVRSMISTFSAMDQWINTVESIDTSVSDQRLMSLIKQGEKAPPPNELTLNVSYWDKDTISEIHEMYSSMWEEQFRPGLGRVYGKLGLRKLDQSNYSSSRNYLARAQALLNPPPGSVLYGLARTHYHLQNYKRASRTLHELDVHYPDHPDRLNLGLKIWIYSNWVAWSGVFFAILIGLGVLLYLFPIFLPALLNGIGEFIGNSLYNRDLYTPAGYTYRMLCNPSRMSDTGFRHWVEALKRMNTPEKAVSILKTRHEEGDLGPHLHVEYGNFLYKANRYEQARQVLDSAMDKRKGLTQKSEERALRHLVQAELETNHVEDAYRWINELLELRPDDFNLLKQAVRLATQLNQWDDWQEHGNQWFDATSEQFTQRTHRRGYSEEDEQLDDPESIANFLLEEYKKRRDVDFSEEPPYRLEFLYKLSKEASLNDEQRISLLEALLENELGDRSFKRYAQELGDLLEENGYTQRAIEQYEEIRDRFPEDLKALETLGSLYVDQDQREKAIETFEKLFQVQRDNVQARDQLFKLGRLYEEEKKFTKAEDCYRTILDNSHFQKPEIQLRLGICQYKEGNPRDALSTFQRIKQGDTEFRARLMTFIGRCLVELEMYDAAVSRINELDLNDAGIPNDTKRHLRYWRGRGFEGSGDDESALDDYRHILASDVEFMDVSDRVDRLQGMTGEQGNEDVE